MIFHNKKLTRNVYLSKPVPLRRKKNKWALMVLFIGTLLLLQLYPGLRNRRIQQDLSEHVLRLHVLAASDNETDQNHKLLVRDAVLSQISTFMEEASTKEEAMALIKEHLPSIGETAAETLRALGDESPVSVSLSKDFFPVKTYGALTFPAGEYDALRVCIGEAQGHNWWCVLYPSLCFIDASTVTVSNDALDTLEEDLQPETYQSLFQEEETPKTVFRFRYLTFLNWFFE